MKTEMTIKSFARTSEKPGSWLALVTIGKDGADRKTMLKDEALCKTVEGNKTGIYEAELTKNGKYWDITGLSFVRPLGDSSQPATNQQAGQSAPSKPVEKTVDLNVQMQNRCISDQVCVKSAADIVVAGITAGAFKDKTGVDMSAAMDSAIVLARGFMAEIRSDVDKMLPKAEEKSDAVKEESPESL